MPRPRPHSIDGQPRPAELVPRAWNLEALDDASLEQIGRHLGLTGKHGDRKRVVRAHLDDAQWVAATLRNCSAIELVSLEALAEAGGLVTPRDLAAIVTARTRRSAEEVFGAVQSLMQVCLVVTLGTGSRDLAYVALLEPPAERVARAVRGLTLPAALPPPEAIPTSGGTDGLRGTIALAALTGHRRLRYNMGGGPNRGQLRRFAKGVGMELDTVEASLIGAEECGLLGARGDRYAPHAAKLRAFARGDMEISDVVIPSPWVQGWVSVAALARAAVRAEVDEWEPGFRSAPDIAATLSGLETGLHEDPRFEAVSANGHTWLCPRTGAEEWTGDGHVTPSFEVLLGPAATLELVAVIALGCELVRIERVLTFRITRASVTAGIASGLTPDDLRRALGRVSRHPLPPNVATLVEEWAAAALPASLHSGLVLTLPAQVADAAADALVPWLVARPAPSVLVVSFRAPSHDVRAVLDKLGLCAPPEPLDQARSDREDARYAAADLEDASRRAEPASPPAPPLPLTFEGDPDLRARVEHALASAAPAPKAPVATTPASDAPRPGTRLASLHAAHRDELQRWARRLPDRVRRQAQEAVAVPHVVAPWLVLSRRPRRELLSRARSLEELLTDAELYIAEGAVSPEGEAVLDEIDFDSDAPSSSPPSSLPPQDPATVRAALDRACASAELVHLRTRSHGEDVIFTVTASAIVRRGNEDVLHALTSDGDEGRVFRLTEVLAVVPADQTR